MKTEKDSKVNPSSTKKHDALSAMVSYSSRVDNDNNLEKKRNWRKEREARIRRVYINWAKAKIKQSTFYLILIKVFLLDWAACVELITYSKKK